MIMKFFVFSLVTTLMFLNAAFAGEKTSRLQEAVEFKIRASRNLQNLDLTVLKIDPRIEIRDMLRFPLDLATYAYSGILYSHVNMTVQKGGQVGRLRCLVANDRSPGERWVNVTRCQLIDIPTPAGVTIDSEDQSMIFENGMRSIAAFSY